MPTAWFGAEKNSIGFPFQAEANSSTNGANARSL